MAATDEEGVRRRAVADALLDIWSVHHQLRLGQLLVNLAQTWNSQSDPFHLPDEFVLARAAELRTQGHVKGRQVAI